MWWNLVARAGRLGRHRLQQLLAESAHVLLQLVDLLLLAIHRAVERIEQVFREADLGFEFVQSGFHDSRYGDLCGEGPIVIGPNAGAPIGETRSGPE